MSPASAPESVKEPVIELTGVDKIYGREPMAVTALRDVHLRVERGEFVAILGASGSGKSTLMNIIGCLDRPTRGCYRLEGTDVSQLGRNALADVRNRRIGFIFQGHNLLRRTTALENVEVPLLYCKPPMPADERRQRAAAALAQVGLADRLQHLPNQLSGGQQQRVAIARALILNPTILLADEPTGNLDSHTAVEVMKILQDLNDHGQTVLMVTHELDIARHARRFVILRDGAITEDHDIGIRLFAGEELAARPKD